MEFRFTCQPGCTKCCYGDGFVYLSEDDIVRAAGFLGMTPQTFEKRYVYRTRNLRRMRAAKAARCPFVSDAGCAIHPAKPAQCRLYPFWPELIESARAWHGAGTLCPGIGKGELVQIETVQESAREMQDAHPRFYS